MDETGISWASDRDVKFKQVDGFLSALAVSGESCDVTLGLSGGPDSCGTYEAPNGDVYVFHYPKDDTTQYLYESYPMVVNPLEGVENEHFIVWMRTAGLPAFRKLYGKIDDDFKKGDILAFSISANFEVDSFNGAKSIVISTIGEFGGKNSFLGVAYIVVGSVSLLLALLFGLKQVISPRQLGDTRYLGWAK
jgi:hypothetical protein